MRQVKNVGTCPSALFSSDDDHLCSWVRRLVLLCLALFFSLLFSYKRKKVHMNWCIPYPLSSPLPALPCNKHSNRKDHFVSLEMSFDTRLENNLTPRQKYSLATRIGRWARELRQVSRVNMNRNFVANERPRAISWSLGLARTIPITYIITLFKGFGQNPVPLNGQKRNSYHCQQVHSKMYRLVDTLLNWIHS